MIRRAAVLLQQYRKLWHQALWPIDLRDRPRVQVWIIRGLRLIQLIVASIRRHRLFGLASSLTFTTLLSLIPMVALGLSLLKGLGFQDDFLKKIEPLLSSLPSDLAAVADQVLTMVQGTDFRQLGGLGALILVLMAVQLLHRIEGVFNDIWGVQSKRHWVRRTTTYISILVVVPLLSFTAITQLAQFTWREHVLSSPILSAVAMFLLLSLAFAFLYRALTNTLIQWIPLWVASSLSACSFLLWFYVYLTIQPGITRINILYGALASIPIFLIWLNTSWLIVLLGFEIAYAVQHEKSYPIELGSDSISPRAQIGIALALIAAASRAFQSGKGPLDLQEFSEIHGVPAHALRSMATRLSEAGFMAEMASSVDQLLLAKPAESISQQALIDLVLHHQTQSYPLDFGPSQEWVDLFLNDIDACLATTFSTKNLNQIIHGEQDNRSPAI